MGKVDSVEITLCSSLLEYLEAKEPVYFQRAQVKSGICGCSSRTGRSFMECILLMFFGFYDVVIVYFSRAIANII